MSANNKPKSKNDWRLTNHMWLGIFTLAGCGVAAIVADPAQSFWETLSLGTGYVSLVLLFVTLIIGPLNMLKVRKNPVNINIRRDAGIWSGIVALLHGLFSLEVYFDGNWLRYFFNTDNGKLTPSLDLFGLSNDVGLLALGLILFLTVLSNNYFLRKLKGKQWKNLQRTNYGLAVLTLAHTFGQQFNSQRNPILIYGVIVFTLVVLVMQSIGFVIYRQRAGVRKANVVSTPTAVASAATPVAVTESGAVLGRRRFLLVAGAASLASFGLGMAAGPLLSGNAQSKTQTVGLTLPTATTRNSGSTNSTGNTSAAATATPSTSSSKSSGAATATATPTPATSNAGSTSSTGSSKSSGSTSSIGSTSTSGSANSAVTGTVLATVANFPASGVMQFTTPNTGKPAFLIRESDGSIKAFSGSCPHRPYNLTYNASSKQFYCALHSATFDGETGAPIKAPTRSSVASITGVQVDKQGNIVYTAA